MQCAKCQHPNPDRARFCNQCGAPLAAPPAATELKRLTVMFCDLVGSVDLSVRLDPEDFHALLSAYQSTAGEVVRRHHGHVAQQQGDGLVAYFGYPLAGEDDAARAVQAALDIVTAVAARPLREGAPLLQVRLGLHTGSVVMGEIGGGGLREYLALGDTPNIAARLQALAGSNRVVVSAATQRVVQAQFRFTDLGEHMLKGVAVPMRVYQVDEARAGDGDGDPAPPRQAPLLGRAHEFGRLLDAWQAACSGPGRCLLVQGEPGIGKSRLARELSLHVHRAGGTVWLMRCSAYRSDSPFSPLVQLVARAASSAPTPAASEAAAALAAALAGLGLDDATVQESLAVAAPQAPDSPPLSAQALRERTFDAASRVLRGGAARQPTLLVVEDLHWSDPSTLEWLGRLVSRDVDAGLMLLLTARTEFGERGLENERVQRLLVEPCTAEQAAELVRALDTGRALTDEAVARVVARAEGNPLFVEEFTRSALESGGEDIPATLQEQTLARLDRLGTAKQVLQQAAVIGRRFGQRRLRAVCGWADADLAAALQRGVEARLLVPLAERGDAVFAFRHALLQDAANASLLRSARQACHLRVAEALLAEDAGTAERQPEVLAHHYAEGGQAHSAIDLWLRAGRMALARSACMEAAAHVRRALALMGDQRHDEAARALELELQLVLAPALMTVHGVLDARVDQAYSRARQLCEGIGDTPKLLVPLWGLWAYELVRGHVDDARSITRQLAALAGKTNQPMPALVAAATSGLTLFYQGELASARVELARGITLYRTPVHAARSGRSVHDPGVMCHAFDMLACWMLGDTAGAQAGAARLRDMAPLLAPYDAAFLWCGDALLAVLCDDPASARASAGRAIAIAREQAFGAWQMMGSVLLGWGRARGEDSAAGIQQMERAIDAWCATGARNLRPLFQSLLADAWLAHGEPARALDAAEAGLAAATSGERCWVPELHRLRGLALAGVNRPEQALEGLQAARSEADRMQARAWSERARASLRALTLSEEETR